MAQQYLNPQFAAKAKDDPRYQIAQTLLANGLDASPANSGSGLEVLSRALQGYFGGKMIGDTRQDYSNRQQSASDNLAAALGQISGQDASTQNYSDGTTINWDAQQPNMQAGIQTLASNPDTADVATNLQMDQIKSKNALAAKLAEIQAESNKPLTLKEQIDNQYRDREQTTDALGQVIPKYAPMGGQPVLSTSSSPLGMGSAPSPQSVAPTSPSSPSLTGADIAAGSNTASGDLAANPMANTPYARKQVLDAQIKKAYSSPTEAQGQASSRSNLLGSGLRMLEDNLSSPNVSPLRQAVADTATGSALGDYAANKIRTDEESLLSAGRDAALEGLASAVTGAGVTNDQFSRFTNLLPKSADSPTVREAKFNNAYNFLSNQLKVAGPAGEQMRNELDGYLQQRGSGGLATQPQPVGDKSSYDALPSGTQFVAPDGTIRVKP